MDNTVLIVLMPMSYATIILSALFAFGLFPSCYNCNAFLQPQPSTTTTAQNFSERHQSPNLHSKRIMQQSQSCDPGKREGSRVAFIGNSILYYNDCPRFMANLGKGFIEHQDSCLRGGTNLSELWNLGNGMRRHGFGTDAAKTGEKSEDGQDIYDVGKPSVKDLLEGNEEEAEKFDFVVFNDHTQGPARPASRKASQDTLVEHYLPLIRRNDATPIIIETAAYRLPEINNSKDLGSTRRFQQRVREGVQSYVQVLATKLRSEPNRPRMAPVGTAFYYVHENNRPLWEELFDPFDNFHPSPIGTYLQGCVLHCTMFGTPPPLPKTTEEIEDLWEGARVMHHVKTGKNRRLPSVEEAKYLRNVAAEICALESERLSVEEVDNSANNTGRL